MPDDSHTTMSERVLGAIEASGITPKPAWHFLFHEGVIWTVALCAFVSGSVATALTLYITDASFMMERHIERSGQYVTFEMLPYVWILLFVLGIGYTVHAIHRTRKGYRFPTSALVGSSIVLSVICGSVVYASGAGGAIDRYLLATVPAYHPLSGFNAGHWMAPEQGIVAGVVEEVVEDRVLLRDLVGEQRTIVLTASTSLPQMLTLEEGVAVRVIGTTTSTHHGEVFEAEVVRPFNGRGAGPRRGVTGGETRVDAERHEYRRGYVKEMPQEERITTQTGQ